MRPPDQAGLQLGDAVHKPHKGWRACWGKLHCFASSSSSSSSRRRDRRRPHLLPAPSPANLGNGLNAHIAEQMPSSSSLSPVVHAPPSSPASFCYAENLPSSAALLSLFPLNRVNDLCSNATPRCDSSFLCLDPVLVTPPLHSALTTEPTTPLSTAPFTPPPELAHLTTPPSPEVPFAELVPSSLSAKSGDRICEYSTTFGASQDPADAEFENQARLGNPIRNINANTSDVPHPLPERISFSHDDAVSNSGICLPERAAPFGFKQTSFPHSCEHSSPEPCENNQYDEEIRQVRGEKIQTLHVETDLLNLQTNALYMEEHPQTPDYTPRAMERSFQTKSKEQQALHGANDANQRRQNEISGNTERVKGQQS